jgi:hypothetical protein
MIMDMNFCSGYHISSLWSHYLSTESTCDVVMYPRKITTHHQSRGDVNHLVQQYARRTIWLAYTPFISRATRLSIYVAPNANGTIWSQLNHVNAVRLLPANTTSLSYRPIWFERRFIQYSHNFCIKIIKRKSSHAVFIMDVLTTAMYLVNPKLDCLKCINILKNYVWSVCIISWASISSLWRNPMITLWSYSILNILWTYLNLQDGKIIMESIAELKPTRSIWPFKGFILWR